MRKKLLVGAVFLAISTMFAGANISSVSAESVESDTKVKTITYKEIVVGVGSDTSKATFSDEFATYGLGYGKVTEDLSSIKKYETVTPSESNSFLFVDAGQTVSTDDWQIYTNQNNGAIMYITAKQGMKLTAVNNNLGGWTDDATFSYYLRETDNTLTTLFTKVGVKGTDVGIEVYMDAGDTFYMEYIFEWAQRNLQSPPSFTLNVAAYETKMEKEAALADLETAFAGYKEADYSTANWEIITSIYNSAKESVRKLFALYNDLIKANNSKQIDEINRNNKKIEESIKSLVDKLVVLKASPALIDEIAVIAQIEVVVELFKQFKEVTIENQIVNSIQTLKNISDQLKIKIKSIEEDIACIDAKRLQAHNALNEAAAKIYIVENSSYKRKMILSYLRLCRLQGINNKALSKCQKDIEEKVYKDKFVEILQNTLKALNAPAEVKFTTAISSAQMAIKQGYDKIAKTNQLNEILSEGEQTVVALAQFIAESKFNPEENVLFFDDPVNSLDLGRMQIIAENLVELSKEKQVVIFTHNLVFLGFIKAIIDKDESLQHYKFFTTERAEVDGKLYVGKVTETANPNVERLKHYNTKINELIQFYNKNTCTIDNVKQLYGYLRAAIELFICEKVLQGTVERFRFEIRVGKFSEINVAALQKNQLKLTNIFEKCCRFIDGHSSSPYAKLNPDFTGFKADYEEFNQIKKEFK